MNNADLKKTPDQKIIIHRAITVRIGDSTFRWEQICDRSCSVGYGLGLTWNSSEVTCEKCLQILKDSNL